jgi:hypothetical protein
MPRLLLCLSIALAGCNAVPSDQQFYLSLSIDEFNASGSSWRVLEARRDFLGAAKLIEAYLARNAHALPEYELTLAWFHAAQMRAFGGETTTASKHLRYASFRIEPVDWPVPWNHYVAATRAFLQRDRDTLLSMRKRIAEDPRWRHSDVPNLNFVDSLIENFDVSYFEAYNRTKLPYHSPQPTPKLRPAAGEL